ncbi:hypothetical protein VTK26DRAFT_2682 [Humicola hyalothermophila]
MDWPDPPPPNGVTLLRVSGDDGVEFVDQQNAEWPELDIESHLPLHVIRVCSVSIHRGELKPAARGGDHDPPACSVPGYEFSGYVVATSPRSPLMPGTEVFGMTSFTRTGNARTLTVAKFHEIARKPACLTWDESAATPINALTAFQALFDYRLLYQPSLRDWGIGAGNKAHNSKKIILITGASSPAGLWAVQLAKAAGAGKIYATSDPRCYGHVQTVGADKVLHIEDRDMTGFADCPRFSTVLDLVGGAVLTRAWSLVAPGGKVLSVVTDTAQARPAGADPTIQHYNFRLRSSSRQLAVIGSLLDRKEVHPVISNGQDTFDFIRYRDAIEQMRTNFHRHVVLRMPNDRPPPPRPPRDLIRQLRLRGPRWDDVHDFDKLNVDKAEHEDPPQELPAGFWPVMRLADDVESTTPPPLSLDRSHPDG